MSLLNPGPGDLIDRRVILNLKVDAGRVRGLDVGHLLAEIADIDKNLMPKVLHAKWPERLAELVRINRRIWDITDVVRAAEASGGDLAEAGDLAREALRLNWRRAAVVQGINEDFGASAGWEKLP